MFANPKFKVDAFSRVFQPITTNKVDALCFQSIYKIAYVEVMYNVTKQETASDPNRTILKKNIEQGNFSDDQ